MVCVLLSGMILAGPLFGKFISNFVHIDIPADYQAPNTEHGKCQALDLACV